MVSINNLSIFAPRFPKLKITMSDLIKKYLGSEYTEAISKYPDFGPGDTVNVHVKISEGNKERIQQFQGTVIQRRSKGSLGETFTVRKVSNGVGIERIFPIASPAIEKIDLVRKGKVRRARIFYLRGRKGKSARIKEKL